MRKYRKQSLCDLTSDTRQVTKINTPRSPLMLTQNVRSLHFEVYNETDNIFGRKHEREKTNEKTGFVFILTITLTEHFVAISPN